MSTCTNCAPNHVYACKMRMSAEEEIGLSPDTRFLPKGLIMRNRARSLRAFDKILSMKTEVDV